jgi:hypothetical protein
VVSSYDKGIIDLEQAVDYAFSASHDARVIFLDGAAEFLKGDPNRSSTVSEFFLRAAAIGRKYNLTFVAVTCAAKVKEGERYLSPRQRISGSLSWGAKASTVVVIEAERPDDPADLRRKVHILPINSAPKLLHYTLDPKRGSFVIAPGEAENPSEFEEVLFAYPEGSTVSVSDVWGICETLGLSRTTMYRYITQLVEDSRLLRVRDGLYRIPVLQ